MTDARIHPPKREVIDPAARLNIDNKGVPRALRVVEDHGWGVYFDRPADHRLFNRVQSWFLSEPGLRVSKYHHLPGSPHTWDWYVDIGRVWAEGGVWHWEDWYLDLLVYRGLDTAVEDADELLAARLAGELDDAQTVSALDRAFATATGIAAHGHDVQAWAAATGRPLHFGPRVTST